MCLPLGSHLPEPIVRALHLVADRPAARGTVAGNQIGIALAIVSGLDSADTAIDARAELWRADNRNDERGWLDGSGTRSLDGLKKPRGRRPVEVLSILGQRNSNIAVFSRSLSFREYPSNFARLRNRCAPRLHEALVVRQKPHAEI